VQENAEIGGYEGNRGMGLPRLFPRYSHILQNCRGMLK
jgi:hypothetical protein